MIIAVCLLIAGDAAAEPPPFNGNRRPYTQLKAPQPAPLVPLYTARGGVNTLERYRGKVVLLNIWATWCPACLHELPSLARLHARHGDRGLAVLAVSVDDGGWPQMRPYLRRLGVTALPVAADPAGRTLEALDVREGLPWSFIIDRRGRVRGYLMGAADWQSTEAAALLRHYLTEK